MANSATRPAIAALTSLVPRAQILFGSDYPIFPIAMTAGGLSRIGLSGADLQAIERDNAMRLLRPVWRPIPVGSPRSPRELSSAATVTERLPTTCRYAQHSDSRRDQVRQ